MATFTRFTPNRYWIENNVAYFEIYDKQGTKKAEFMIDTIDLPMVKDYRWGVTGEGYLRTTDAFGKRIYLHRMLMTPGSGLVVDHRNGDTLDNRRINLRVVPYSYNLANQYKSRNPRSGHKGVSRHKNGLWRARMCKDDHEYVKYAETIAEAIQLRKELEQELYGSAV